MKGLLSIIVLLFFATGVTAQIQFWNIQDLENEGGNTMRKENKVYQVRVYRTDEFGTIKDSTDMEELLTYDASGRLIARVHYKYDWNKKKTLTHFADSISYYADGTVSRYRAYEGADLRLMRETETLVNRKGQIVKWTDYSYLNWSKELDGYQTVKYNAKNKIAEINWFGADKKKRNTQLFIYDAAGRLIKDTRTGGGMASAIYNIGRNTKGAIQKYEEFYGKQLQKKMAYTYDANGRMLKKVTTTTSGYDDFTDYYYEGESKLLSRSYLQYSGYSDNKNDRRHEYRKYIYSFY